MWLNMQRSATSKARSWKDTGVSASLYGLTYPEESQMPCHKDTRQADDQAHKKPSANNQPWWPKLSHPGTASSSPRQDFSDCSFRWHLDYTLPGSPSTRAKAKMLLHSWSTETVWENNAYYCFILWVFCLFVFALRIIFTIAVTNWFSRTQFLRSRFLF